MKTKHSDGVSGEITPSVEVAIFSRCLHLAKGERALVSLHAIVIPTLGKGLQPYSVLPTSYRFYFNFVTLGRRGLLAEQIIVPVVILKIIL